VCMFLLVRLQVITSTRMKMTVFCDVAPCSLVDITDVSDEPIACLMSLVMEAVNRCATSQKLAVFYFILLFPYLRTLSIAQAV
jgi:hypothetical protein